MWVSAFSEDEDEEEDEGADEGNGTTSPAEAEYSFAGFNIDFSEKVALMPASAPANGGVRRDG